MSNYNIMNNCCCTYGMKYAICILGDLISAETLIDTYQFYSSCGTFNENSKLVQSRYPNFILLQEEIDDPGSTSQIKNTNICIDDIDYIRISPNTDQSAKIINELNKYYISPSVLHINCNESCCCKNSSAAFMQNKYMNLEWANRQFRVKLRDNNYVIPEMQADQQDFDNFVTVIHMDYDVAWLWDQQSKIFYLVSLCKICALIDIE